MGSDFKGSHQEMDFGVRLVRVAALAETLKEFERQLKP